jgi:hypothetical protein
MSFLYMAVTADIYELPLVCESNAPALARKIGVLAKTVHECISAHKAVYVFGEKALLIKVRI